MKMLSARKLQYLEGRTCFVCLGLLLWFSLDISYRIFVTPLYSYSGFGFDINVLKYLEGLSLYTIFLFFSPRVLSKPSDYFMCFLLFGLLAPLLLLYGLDDRPRSHLYIVLLGYFLIEIFRRGRRVKIPFLKNGAFIAKLALLASVLGVTGWMFFSGGYRYFNLDLSKVYEFRRDAGAVINAGIMSYINVWATKVFGPALIAVALWRRWWHIVVLTVVCQIIWFGISNHKAVLFYPLLIFFLWFWFRRTRALSLLALGMSGVVFLSLLLYLAVGEKFIASLFVRRVFFVIANNTFDYYEFFSNNPFVYWSNSITSSWISYPYDIGYAKLIGEWRGTEAHVNNNFLSTGYMHAGIAGIVFYGIIAGLLFRLIDSVSSKGIPLWVAVSVLIVPSRSLLLSADLPTALLTHGIAVGTIVLFLLRSKAHLNNENSSPNLSSPAH